MWFIIHKSKAVLEIIFGMRVHITNEDFSSHVKNEKVVIIMNHRTRLDWLYYWSVIFRQQRLEHEKIILKNELKHIPGAGWGMQTVMFLFIKRNWDKDKEYLRQILHYFTDINYPLQLLIFPEGTDLDTHSLEKSKSYALKNNLPIYKYVLHPRLKGFTYCVEQLRSRHGIDAIYDVTVGYVGNMCTSESDLAKGRFPQDVHFHIKRHPIGSIPESTEGLEKWCKERWAEKETTLEQFYKEGNFIPQHEEKSMVDEMTVKYQMIFWIVYWFTFLCVVFMLLYKYWWVRWYTLIMFIVFFLQSTFGGGFETLQVKQQALNSKHVVTKNNGHASSKYGTQNSNGKTR
ncbi:lysocardiolipin acyltransferase 1-like [Dendronephthya gigantea]|uniref:lysocardiolipin acyltransferase 1-like n=1 Tax=Dendronephthya gigantea TaxID=151771 RepID=UPI00106A944E|nr:lysocardiolipin acyltransferase 1-like [Dendronephthya gigantea]